MDAADRAKEKEMMERQSVIDAHANRERLAPHMFEGKAHCCDCLVPIPKERLEATPDAARCVECQTYHEQKQKRCV